MIDAETRSSCKTIIAESLRLPNIVQEAEKVVVLGEKTGR